MNPVMIWAGFLGAWLLVAGPLYQGALELREQDIDRDEIQATMTKVARPEAPSPWWWLLPPAMYVISSRRSKQFRDRVMEQLTPLQREQFTRYKNKAIGWFAVATGATLLAADQTWRLTEHYGWPGWTFWLLFVITLGVAVSNTSLRMIRNEQPGEPDRQPVGNVASPG